MPFDATRLTQLGRVSAIALAPDQSWIAVQVARLDADEKRYISDLWRVSTSGSPPPRRLTHGDWNDTAPRFRRDGSLAFLSDRPVGDDTARRRQVWLLPATGGEPLRLTDEPLGVSDYRFAREASRLVILADVLPGVPHEQQRARARDFEQRGPTGLHYRSQPIRFWDHWLAIAAPHAIAYDEDGGARRDMTPDADGEYRPTDLEYGWDVSADGRRVVLPARRTTADRTAAVSLHVIDIDGGARVELDRRDGAMAATPLFSPDGELVACTRYLRDPGRYGRITLELVPTAGGASRTVAAAWDTWPSLEAWSPDGRALLASADASGIRPVYSVDVASGEVTRITAESAGGSHGNVAIGGGFAYGIRSTLLDPPEPFRVAMTPDASPQLLARLSGWSSGEGEAIATVESFETAGDGGTPVQSFLLRPTAGASPLPVQLWIHGGPVSQYADGWHWRWNPLVAAGAGYAVLLPNPRGSTGRGQAFIEGVWPNEWGAACYRDVIAVADHVPALGGLDSERVAVLGGSFGGYMANWIGGQTDRFRCLVTHASIYHFPAFHGATDESALFAVEFGGTPYRDLASFEKYSPHRFVGEWKTPTLIIHGEKDYRVPVSEALLLFEALQIHGVESELLVFPDENHWILRPQNSRQWYERILDFVGRHLAPRS